MQKNLKKILSAVLTIVMLLSLCAPVFPVSAAEELTKVEKWNLVLGDEIAVNFYVSVSDGVSDDAVMYVTDGYGEQQYPLSEAEKDDSGNYKFTARLAAAQLADTITLQLHDGENQGSVHSYTAVEYAQKVLNGNYGESTKTLVKAMLHYGAAAQTYFGYNTGNLANAGIAAAEAVEIPAVDASNMVSGSLSGISFYGASLVFQSKVAVRFYFKVTGNIADYTFSNGTPIAKDGLYYVEVADINPQDYANPITLTVNDALTVTYSPLTYISRMASSTNQKLVQLVKAMYAYHLAAVNYAPDAEGSIELVTVTFADVQLVDSPVGTITNGPKALKDHLNYAKSIDADVLLMPGDIVNNADQSYYDRFWSIFKSVYGEDESQWPELIWTMGNHEWYDLSEKNASNAISMFKANAKIDTPNLVKMSQIASETNPGETVANYYKVVNGVPFVVISGDSVSMKVSAAQQAELISWLNEINELPSVKAGTPIYVAYHGPIEDVTFFGQGASDESKAVDEVLKNYPNTIVFTGHTHYTNINERTINQVDYTAINLGSSSYSCMVNRSATSQPGDKYYNVGGSDQDAANGDVAFGYEYVQNLMVMKNYTDGSVNMDRYVTDTGAADARKVGITWNFPAGLSKDKFIYTNDRFQNQEWANTLYGKDGLVFHEDAEISFSVDGTEMMVYFDDVTDHNYAEHYRITVTADGVTSKTYDVMGNYYKYYEEAETYHFLLADIPAGTNYTVEVKAYDFFDNESLNSLLATTESATSLFPDKVETSFAGTYTDISTKINYEVTAGGVSSLECYYRGDYLYSAGATLGTVLSSEDLALAEEFTVTDWSHGILTVKVKNVGDVDIKVGVTIVVNENGKEKWVTDFGTAYQYTVKADGEWAELTWDLNDLFGINSLDDVNAIRLKAKSTAASADGYTMHLYLDDIDILQGEPVETDEPDNTFDGGEFSAGTGLTMDLDNDQAVTRLSFDYKIDSGDYFNIAWMSDWSNWFGYFEFNASGATGTYAGVTTRDLGDGTIRVNIDFSKVTAIQNTPTNVLKILYIRGSETTANGTIHNIRINEAAEAPLHGELVAGGKDHSFTAEADAYDQVVFDIIVPAVGGDQEVGFALLDPSWQNYYGYFYMESTGLESSYSGVSAEKLSDGYYRVTLNIAEITDEARVHGTVETIDRLYIHHNTTDCYIDNVQFIKNDEPVKPENPTYTEIVTPGGDFTSGKDLTIALEEGVYDVVTMDYKITSGEYINFVVMSPDWQNWYGYFELNGTVNGASYDGVTYEQLANGYIRVTLDIAKLTQTGEKGKPATMGLLYISGARSNASGTVDNVRCLTISQSEEPEDTYTEIVTSGGNFTSGSGLTIDLEEGNYDIVTFDYQITDGEYFEFVIMGMDWQHWYGYFNMDGTLNSDRYEGVACEQLDNGYIRVILDIAKLNVVSDAGAPSSIARFYLSGSRNKATGIIDNIRCLTKVTDTGDDNTGDDSGDNSGDDEPEIDGRGRRFAAGEGVNIDLGAGTFSTVTMEYRITNSGTFSMVVCGSWNDYYGYYDFDANGTMGNYAGISSEMLEDGYVRVTFDVAALNVKTGEPTQFLKFLYISSGNNTADGFIDQVSVVDYREEVIRGEAFTAGVNWAVDAEKEAAYGAVTFDYKITDDGTIDVALLDEAWNCYYGYFTFDKNGATRNYAGVTTLKRSNGYIYVTFDVDALTTISSKGEPAAIGAIRIRGSASTANGYIDNVQFKDSVNPTGIRFGVLSDVHVGNDDTQWASNHLRNALTAYKKQGVDAIVITGDLQNHYKDPYTVEDCKMWIENLADVWFEVFPDGINDLTGEPVEPILIYGNHDQLLVAEEYWPSRFGEYTDAYLKEVNGYYFVGAQYQREYAAAALLDYAEENSNGYPFFYMQHCPMIDILYGEDLDATDFETGMTMRDDLWNVSNAITFSGHTHLPATDERSIYQPSDADDAQFTAIQVPSLNYARLSDLGYDVPGDASASKQGLYVVVEGSEVTVSRLSFADSDYPTGEKIGADWVFDAADSTDKPYGYETRANAAKPAFSADAQINVLANSGNTVTFSFPAATVTVPEGFSDQIQSYYIEVANAATGEIVFTQNFVTNYFLDAKPENFAGPYTVTANGLEEDVTYLIRVYAKEFYQVSSEPLTMEITTAKTVIRGQEIVAGESYNIVTNITEPIASVSFEYKIISGEKFNIAVLPNWSSYYGYVACYASGYRGSDPGVSFQVLPDGYIRVTLDLAKMTTMSGTPTNVIELLYIRGSSSDANGYIDNIQYVTGEELPDVTEPEVTEPEVTEPETTEPAIRGEEFAAGSSTRIYFTEGVYNTVTFDYKITEGEVMQFALLQDSAGSAYYGRFTLTATGEQTDYAGVEVTALSDGYYRVTVNIAEVTESKGTPTVLSTFYIRGSGTTASGYVDLNESDFT